MSANSWREIVESIGKQWSGKFRETNMFPLKRHKQNKNNPTKVVLIYSVMQMTHNYNYDREI